MTGDPFAVAAAVTPFPSAHRVAIAVNVIGVPTSASKPEDGDSNQSFGAPLHVTALLTLSRPPVAV